MFINDIKSIKSKDLSFKDESILFICLIIAKPQKINLINVLLFISLLSFQIRFKVIKTLRYQAQNKTVAVNALSKNKYQNDYKLFFFNYQVFFYLKTLKNVIFTEV